MDPVTGADTLLTSTQGWVWGGPVSDGQNIYFGDLDGNLFAVDAASGNQSWSIQPDGPVVGSPVVISENIVFATESGSVYAVDSGGKDRLATRSGRSDLYISCCRHGPDHCCAHASRVFIGRARRKWKPGLDFPT